MSKDAMLRHDASHYQDIKYVIKEIRKVTKKYTGKLQWLPPNYVLQ